MGSTWKLIIQRTVAILLAVLGLTYACTSRRGTGPVPESYYLYVGVQGGWSGRVAIVDCELDSVVDSITYDFAQDVFAHVSSDGSYLATHEPARPPMIWDLATKTPLGRLPESMASVLLLSESGLVLGQPFDSVQVISLPDLQVVDVWQEDLAYLQCIPGSPNVIGAVPYVPRETPGPDKLVIFDPVEKRVVDSAFGYDCELGGFHIKSFSLSPDGRRVYVVGGHSAFGPSVAGWDLAAREVLFHGSLFAGTGYCRVSPDNRELWVTDPGYSHPMMPRGPGLILVYDASDGAILDTIHTLGVDPRQPDEPLFVQDIRFHPNAEKVYVSGSGQGDPAPPGPVLVIDQKPRTIRHLLFDKSLERVASIGVAPAP